MKVNCQLVPKHDFMRQSIVARLLALGFEPVDVDGRVVVDYEGDLDGKAMALISVYESFGCDRAIVFKDWGSDEGQGTQAQKRPSGSTCNQQRMDARDFHHICYQRRHWHGLWAKRLREHPYMGAKIPMHTLHRKVHETIHDIPCPNEDVCERVYRELERLIEDGMLDVEHDSLDLRISTLIELLGHCESNLEATLATLRWQRQIVQKFYRGAS